MSFGNGNASFGGQGQGFSYSGCTNFSGQIHLNNNNSGHHNHHFGGQGFPSGGLANLGSHHQGNNLGAAAGLGGGQSLCQANFGQAQQQHQQFNGAAFGGNAGASNFGGSFGDQSAQFNGLNSSNGGFPGSSNFQGQFPGSGNGSNFGSVPLPHVNLSGASGHGCNQAGGLNGLQGLQGLQGPSNDLSGLQGLHGASNNGLNGLQGLQGLQGASNNGLNGLQGGQFTTQFHGQISGSFNLGGSGGFPGASQQQHQFNCNL